MTISSSGLEVLPTFLARGKLVRLARELIALRRRGNRLISLCSITLGPFIPARLWVAINSLAGRHFRVDDHTLLSNAAADRLATTAQARGLDLNYRPRRNPAETRLWTMRRFDFGNSRKAALGGWGIDVRDPTADRRLVELCLSIPPELYMSDGLDRALFHSAFGDRLPDKVLGERRRGYQGADWHEGLESDLGQLHEEVARISGLPLADEILDVERMRDRAANLPKQSWNSPEAQTRYRIALLRGVSAGHFLRRVRGSN